MKGYLLLRTSKKFFHQTWSPFWVVFSEGRFALFAHKDEAEEIENAKWQVRAEDIKIVHKVKDGRVLEIRTKNRIFWLKGREDGDLDCWRAELLKAMSADRGEEAVISNQPDYRKEHSSTARRPRPLSILSTASAGANLMTQRQDRYVMVSKRVSMSTQSLNMSSRGGRFTAIPRIPTPRFEFSSDESDGASYSSVSLRPGLSSSRTSLSSKPVRRKPTIIVNTRNLGSMQMIRDNDNIENHYSDVDDSLSVVSGNIDENVSDTKEKYQVFEDNGNLSENDCIDGVRVQEIPATKDDRLHDKPVKDDDAVDDSVERRPDPQEEKPVKRKKTPSLRLLALTSGVFSATMQRLSRGKKDLKKSLSRNKSVSTAEQCQQVQDLDDRNSVPPSCQVATFEKSHGSVDEEGDKGDGPPTGRSLPMRIEGMAASFKRTNSNGQGKAESKRMLTEKKKRSSELLKLKMLPAHDDIELKSKLEKWKQSADTESPVFSGRSQISKFASRDRPSAVPRKSLRFQRQQLQKLLSGEICPDPRTQLDAKHLAGLVDRLTMQMKAEARRRRSEGSLVGPIYDTPMKLNETEQWGMDTAVVLRKNAKL